MIALLAAAGGPLAMIRACRTLLAGFAVGVVPAVLMGTGAAGADAPHLSLDPFRGPLGTTVTARGTGFCSSCGPVEIDFVARPVARGIVVASDGSFQARFQVPGGAQGGTDAVNAYQQGSLVTQTAFTVTPSIAAPTATVSSSPSPGPSPGGEPSPGGGAAPAPQASTTPAVSGVGPSPAPSGGHTGSSLGGGGGSGSGPPAAAIALSAVAGALAIAAAATLLRRRLKAKTHS